MNFLSIFLQSRKDLATSEIPAWLTGPHQPAPSITERRVERADLVANERIAAIKIGPQILEESEN